MKTFQEIIKETYKTKLKVKEQVKRQGLTLDDVGVTIFNHNPRNSDAIILDTHKSDAPIVLYFNQADNKVTTLSIAC